MSKKAIITGASGLVGSALLHIILKGNDYDQVVIFVRKKLNIQHPKLEQQVIDFSQLKTIVTGLNAHAIFSCLGTTKQNTPDRAEYRKIDHDYPIILAQAGKANQTTQFHYISSPGADLKSSVFYLRLKAETDADLKKLNYHCLHLYKPSLLTGRKESRPLETMFVALWKLINPLLMGGLKKYRSIAGTTVAQAMYNQSLKNMSGLFVYDSQQIKELGQK